METGAYGPVELPSSAWQRSDVRDALTTRDIPALLRLTQRYTGVSQARLAAALGMGQGRVNEIINGKRAVSQLDVFERIAHGLVMPDHARALLGLAPHRLTVGALAGPVEIAHVYASQADVEHELRRQAKTAKRVDILAVRVLGLVALNDSLLRGPLMTRQESVAVRVLLLDPAAPAALVRAAEIAESAESFSAGIRLSLTRLAELAELPHTDIEIRLYEELPIWRMLAFDDMLFLSAFGVDHEGHRSGVYKLTAATDGVLHAGFRRHYEDLWRRSRRWEGASRDRG
ncbi:helix-turn-helix domain-containing protein [Actinomadura harenae]|uniref:XRE family transcriptional regulator n=1 Tax=Actinomadura harenae TaxID=2483351 RepID=A0A3M2M6A4_9ACTN|nr:helix-turn-helix transcriptional regulator [Actinomadura harenae]RMI45116.1 XRE family transcriptional regulator [Actinomadura harenae]